VPIAPWAYCRKSNLACFIIHRFVLFADLPARRSSTFSKKTFKSARELLKYALILFKVRAIDPCHNKPATIHLRVLFHKCL
jgi:hypothetical protein